LNFTTVYVINSRLRSHGQSPAGPNENGRKANPPKTKGLGVSLVPQSLLLQRPFEIRGFETTPKS